MSEEPIQSPNNPLVEVMFTWATGEQETIHMTTDNFRAIERGLKSTFNVAFALPTPDREKRFRVWNLAHVRKIELV